MPDYFKPLQRKIGVLTLVMGLAMMATWVRSQNTADVIHLEFDPLTLYCLASKPIGIVSSRARYPTPREVPRSMIGGRIKFKSAKPENVWPTNELTDPYEGFDFRKKSVLFGFMSLTVTMGSQGDIYEINTYVIPYWSLMLPTTLISAWLLLSKPRASPQKDKKG